MGMLATVMNSLAMRDAMRVAGIKPRAVALSIEQVVEPYTSAGKAIRYLEQGGIVIFAALAPAIRFHHGYRCAARRRNRCREIVLKATKVDGIYTADPKKDASATRYDRISFDGHCPEPGRSWTQRRFTLLPRPEIAYQCFLHLQGRCAQTRGSGRKRRHAGRLLRRILMIADLKKYRTEDAEIAGGAQERPRQGPYGSRPYPGLLDHIQVEYYGSMVPLSQVANVTWSMPAQSAFSRGKTDGRQGRKPSVIPIFGLNPRRRAS